MHLEGHRKACRLDAKLCLQQNMGHCSHVSLWSLHGWSILTRPLAISSWSAFYSSPVIYCKEWYFRRTSCWKHRRQESISDFFAVNQVGSGTSPSTAWSTVNWRSETLPNSALAPSSLTVKVAIALDEVMNLEPLQEKSICAMFCD